MSVNTKEKEQKGQKATKKRHKGEKTKDVILVN